MPVMTTQQKAYAQYKNNKVMGASGPELTLMLYDGAIKFLNIADFLLKCADFIVNIRCVIDLVNKPQALAVV